MNKNEKFSTGQKIIIIAASFVITFITVCTFFKSDINFLLVSRSVERKYGNSAPNNYFVEDNFNFVNNYEKLEVNSKQDIINSIYYIINSGATYSERYCGKKYTECYNDMTAISNDDTTLSLLNNFVHPYNSFDSITFNFDNNIIEIEIKHTYSESDIKETDEKVNKIIQENIKNNMTTKDKIKTIHDYIINNTDYDVLKSKDINNNTYKSNTAYGVLIQGFGICSGYSDTMALFLNKLNIINYKVSNNDHIWNLVHLDNKWLHLDLTWDDPVSNINITRDNYFLIDYKTLQLQKDEDHSFNKSIFTEAIN